MAVTHSCQNPLILLSVTVRFTEKRRPRYGGSGRSTAGRRPVLHPGVANLGLWARSQASTAGLLSGDADFILAES